MEVTTGRDIYNHIKRLENEVREAIQSIDTLEEADLEHSSAMQILKDHWNTKKKELDELYNKKYVIQPKPVPKAPDNSFDF